MNEFEKYYREKLYPLQNGVLKVVADLKTPFFLSGGTALSRYYYNHRYSDDLDLFVNSEENYPSYIESVLSALTDPEKTAGFYLNLNSILRGVQYTRFDITTKKYPNVDLRIEMINDIDKHYGGFNYHKTLGKIDSWQNILSNKLTALFRNEPKDVVDIFTISRHQQFNWKKLVNEAKSKEAGAEPDVFYELLLSFPEQYLNEIRWIEKPDKKYFMKNIKMIADDILYGRDNSTGSQ